MEILMQAAKAQFENTGNKVAALRFLGAIDSATASWAADALLELEKSTDAFVIAASEGSFCAGYDINEINTLIQESNWDGLDKLSLSFQKLTGTIRSLSKPVVAAVNGPAMDIGVELAMSCDAVCEAEAEYGFTFNKNGFSLMGGGLSEIALDTYEIGANVAGLDIVPFLKRVHQYLYMGAPCKGFAEAKNKGIPLAGAYVCPAGELLEKSKREALNLFAQGYTPQRTDRTVMVTGSTGKAAMEIIAINMNLGKFIPDQILELAGDIAWVLSGGDVPKGTLITEDRLLQCEREAFVKACKRQAKQKEASA